MTAMAEMSVEPQDPQRWKKNSTRQAILDAARRLAEREGAEAVTLGRVAAEAGFAPPAVYAYFVTKDELHLALVADDLEAIAEAMRGEAPETVVPEAEVLAFQRPPRADAEPDAAPEPTDDAAADAGPQEVTGDDAAADEITSVAEPSPLIGEMAAPVEDSEEDCEAVEPVSLSEIQQAIGIVLDAADEAPEQSDEIPDAFPEDALDPELEIAAALVPAVSPSVEEERPAVKRSEARWRRSRKAREEAQLPMLLAEPDGGPSDEPVSEGPDEAPVEPAPQDSSALTETLQPEDATAAAIARLEDKLARLENRPVDAWLERRLRVFERTLADLEARMEKAERDSATALAQTGEGQGDLEQRLGDALDAAQNDAQQRDEHQRAAFADLRAYVKDMAGRLGALETSFSRAMGEAQPGPLPNVQPFDELAEPTHEEEPSRPHDGPADYLIAARRAASAAALKAEASGERGRFSVLAMPRKPRRGRTALLVLTAVMILAVAAIGLAIVLRAHAPAAPVAPPAAVGSNDARVVALAKAGNAQAELIAGLKLLNGDGTETDIPSAAFWLAKAAQQRQPVAEYWLGTLYERGRGVAADKGAALGWYKLAAQAGNAKAMYRLGVGYAEGWTGTADPSAAAKWFQAAAKLGVIDAQFNLAVLYERGTGVPKDLAKAFTWYAIAAGQGDAESKTRIDALASQLSAADVERAQAAAAAFKPASPALQANEPPSVAAVAESHR